MARVAGVSRQTVSNALNAPQRVRAQTLTRVIAVIDSLGYIPDQSARSLKTGLRYTLGYMAPDDDPLNPNPVMGGFLTALCDAAALAGYRILLFRPTEDPKRAIDTLAAARQVDGFILSDILANDVRVQRLTELGLPFMTFGRTEPEQPQHWVDTDNVSGMREIAGALAAEGHRSVAYVYPEALTPWLRKRAEGFTEAARELDLSVILIHESPEHEPHDKGLVERLRTMLRGENAPTAVVTGNDVLAMSVYDAARAAGLRVGTDVAVVGFSDLPLCQFLTPQLASVRMPLTAIAQKIIEQLLAQIRKEPTPEQGFYLQPELILRDSFYRTG
ncbi:LacI family DNA-binding transcriptional regulator [Arthrobacter sp. MYb227]|uniref:LacI family DNA-binding transcriptional regulator n=1 Tax=Arthrobacter sp. MYb227 TaxID=1848601 RepID=UPI001C614394|nr:LacI family DNA-binding transcriptional regulator [Arthrobacter sp. MYb227]